MEAYGILFSYGGREASLQAQAKEGIDSAKAESKGLLAEAEEKGKGIAEEARRKAIDAKNQLIK